MVSAMDVGGSDAVSIIVKANSNIFVCISGDPAAIDGIEYLAIHLNALQVQLSIYMCIVV